jgi:hypothetical protein
MIAAADNCECRLTPYNAGLPVTAALPAKPDQLKLDWECCTQSSFTGQLLELPPILFFPNMDQSISAGFPQQYMEPPDAVLI